MKKTLLILMIFLGLSFAAGCQQEVESQTESDIDIYRLLMDAEDLSGMANKTKSIITMDGDLGLPMSYQGVTIAYASRNESVISHLGVVTRPNECWIESRDQQGLNAIDYQNLNDNWPVLLDVTLSYEGQTRTAKLLFVVAPREGFTCQKYLG